MGFFIFCFKKRPFLTLVSIIIKLKEVILMATMNSPYLYIRKFQNEPIENLLKIRDKLLIIKKGLLN